MTAKSFLKFMEHFKKHSHASKDNPVLLILDNHESHVSIEVISYAKSNGITLLTLPPHCSNKLQPLDIAVYSSFKSRYNTALSNCMLSNPGRTVTIYQIPGFIKTIMSQAFSQANILSGFKKSRIHAYNDNLFSDEDFMCSAVTDRDISNENYELPSSSSQCRQAQLVFSSAQQDPPDFPQSFNDLDQEILSTSQLIPNDEVQDPPSSPVLDLNNVSLLDSVTVSLTNNQLNPPAQKSPQTSDKVLKKLFTCTII
ncbi:unnamed protein product [Parnassius apollo]|uniref:(apollo) hypothetical protein n=1 Tax=Parnassius apollo TaxID=110799 RepID=A0A8S3XGT2_PARAO|nr:unnamed protein product [Parnassius apollo]